MIAGDNLAIIISRQHWSLIERFKDFERKQILKLFISNSILIQSPPAKYEDREKY